MTKNKVMHLIRLRIDQIGLKSDPKALNLDETGIIFLYNNTCFWQKFFLLLAWLGESDLKLLLTGNHDSRTAETMFYTSHTFALQGLYKLCPIPPISFIGFYTMPRFCWKPLTHYHFNTSYFPSIRRRFLLFAPIVF